MIADLGPDVPGRTYYVVMFDHLPVAVSTEGRRDAEEKLEKYRERRYKRYLEQVASPLNRQRWNNQFLSKIVEVTE